LAATFNISLAQADISKSVEQLSLPDYTAGLINDLVHVSEAEPLPTPGDMARHGLVENKLNLALASKSSLPIGASLYVPVYEEDYSIWSIHHRQLMGFYLTQDGYASRNVKRVTGESAQTGLAKNLATTGDQFLVEILSANDEPLLSWVAQFESIDESRGSFSLEVMEVIEHADGWNLEIGSKQIWDAWGWIRLE